MTKPIERDRTGEICPICKKGKLFPSGKVMEIEEENITSGVSGRGEREYICDSCGRRFNSYGIEIRDSLRINKTAKKGNQHVK
ncbi:MAG: hypothetical protein QXH07_05300 [Thermoplasmata archaeon]